MVIGFNVIFAMMGFSLSRISSEALKNYAIYYTNSQVHNIAQSAVNVAANQIFFTPNWRDGYSNVPFGGGTYSVLVQNLANRRIRIRATATMKGPNPKTTEYEDKTSIIVVVMQPSSFSKFAYYSMIEGSIYWATKDTVWGPIHTQDKLRVAGNPVFFGKATAKNGLYKNPSSSAPEFHGGFQSGVSISMPSDMSPMKGSAQTGGHYVSGVDVNLVFNADGTVTYQEGAAAAQTVPLSTYAPNGVIVVDGGNVHMKGTLKGRATVGVLKNGVSGKGQVWLDDDVVYTKSPTDPECDDMLGIAADEDIWVADNVPNKTDINIMASMFSKNGGFGAENYSSLPISGQINLWGGIQQYQRNAVGTLSGGLINHGFNKNYRYDPRLLTDLPPEYPTTGSYEVLSWYE